MQQAEGQVREDRREIEKLRGTAIRCGNVLTQISIHFLHVARMAALGETDWGVLAEAASEVRAIYQGDVGPLLTGLANLENLIAEHQPDLQGSE